MFTDKFIPVPIKLYSIEQKELTGKEDSEDSVMKMNPFEVSRYNPSAIDDDDDQYKATAVTFRDGETVTIYLTIEEFEKLLNSIK